MDELTPQPYTLEGFENWAKEIGHFMVANLLENFRKFTQDNKPIEFNDNK